MKFKDFWRLGFYINRVAIQTEDGEMLYEGFGKRLSVKDFADHKVTSFFIERSTLVITVESEEK